MSRSTSLVGTTLRHPADRQRRHLAAGDQRLEFVSRQAKSHGGLAERQDANAWAPRTGVGSGGRDGALFGFGGEPYMSPPRGAPPSPARAWRRASRTRCQRPRPERVVISSDHPAEA